MRLSLRIWRQKDRGAPGLFVTYPVDGVTPEMSFLEMLDVLNEDLTSRGEEPVAFEHDCREGICGSCGFLIDGVPHGPRRHTTVCQLHMRFFKDGDALTLEPWRARAFPVVRDLVVDRSAFDRIIQAGGYITAPTGSAPDANAILVGKEAADTAFDAAACIGCGACVAACPNAAAMLFTAAKVTHLNALPQGVQVRDLGRGEQHGGGVGTRGHAGATADARGGVERGVSSLFPDQDRVGVGSAPGRRRDIAARLDDAVEGRAIDDEVSDDGEGGGTPRLERQRIAVLEEPHEIGRAS